MKMHVSEGLRRVAIVIGVMLAVVVAAVGYADRPTEDRLRSEAAAELLRIAAIKQGAPSGYALRESAFPKYSNGAVVETLCQGGYGTTDPGMQLICATYKDNMRSIGWANTKHFAGVAVLCAAALLGSLLAWSVLVWVGRGFTLPTAPAETPPR